MRSLRPDQAYEKQGQRHGWTHTLHCVPSSGRVQAGLELCGEEPQVPQSKPNHTPTPLLQLFCVSFVSLG